MSSPVEKTYQANCHCGAVRYEAKVSPPLEDDHEVVSCNCSICIRNGLLHIYLPKSKVKFTQGEDKLKRYEYLTLVHRFCPNCATSMTVTTRDPSHSFADKIALNVRAFRDLDETQLRIKRFDLKDKPPKYEV